MFRIAIPLSCFVVLGACECQTKMGHQPARSGVSMLTTAPEFHDDEPWPKGQATANVRSPVAVGHNLEALQPGNTAFRVRISGGQLTMKETGYSPNTYLTIHHASSGELIGKTSAVRNDPNPSYTETLHLELSFTRNDRYRFVLRHSTASHRGLGFIEIAAAALINAGLSGKRLSLPLQTIIPQQEDDPGVSKPYSLEPVHASRNHGDRPYLSFTVEREQNQDAYRARFSSPSVRSNVGEILDYQITISKSGHRDPLITLDPAKDSVAELFLAAADVRDSYTLAIVEKVTGRPLASRVGFEMGELVGKLDRDATHVSKVFRQRAYRLTGEFESEVVFEEISFEHLFRLASYLKYLQLIPAYFIDFTESNGPVHRKNSLHHNLRGGLSPYENVVWQIGRYLNQWNRQSALPIYGFGFHRGLKRKSEMQIASINELNDRPEQGPTIPNSEIIKEIQRAKRGLKLSGPSYLAPLIRKAIAEAIALNADTPTTPRRYLSAMILTDGVIHDREESFSAILAAAKVPVSIVIVGIGPNVDRKAMEILDGDDFRAEIRVWAKERGLDFRDLVHFVLADDFMVDGMFNAGQFNEAVAEELPTQIIDFMKIRDLTPYDYTQP